jgi:hypothetical protein
MQHIVSYVQSDAEVWAGVAHRAIIGFSFLAIVFVLLIGTIGTQKLEAYFKEIRRIKLSKIIKRLPNTKAAREINDLSKTKSSKVKVWWRK